MKRILINATHNEEIRVALCKDNHLYDFDLENRTREQKKANIYKGHITRVEPSLEAVFVEYGSTRQGFLPLREIAPEYLKGNPRSDNIRELIKEGDEVIIQVEKEERGNKGAAVSTYISLAGRYLVLMPNNAKGGGISRQISGKVRDEIRSVLANLNIPKGMSVIVRTAGIGKSFEELELDLANLLDTWSEILNKTRTEPSPILLYQEAGVVTRAMRDYLRDDIGEIWIDSEHAYNEAANFISSVMPAQMGKLRKYTDYEPLFVRFGIERQIESAYQREVRLPSGGSIVIDQTEAMVAIDINSAKSTKGSDVAETAFHTNLEAADEIARQLRLRDMGGLIVIDFIDMADVAHQKAVEKRLIDATRYDRARVQFAEISKFGLMEMSRQRLRPSLDEATGYICPRCHGNGMIRDLRSLALSIMRQIEQIALKERMGELQAEVPTEIAAFLLNEKRESLVYLEQDSGTRITILPHAHLESPNFSLHFNPDGFAPSSYERIVDVEERQNIDRGYEVNWQTPEPTTPKGANHWDKSERKAPVQKESKPAQKEAPAHEPKAVAWLSNLFAPKAQASLAPSLNTNDVAAAIETLVNGGATSLGASGQLTAPSFDNKTTFDKKEQKPARPRTEKTTDKSERAGRVAQKDHNKDAYNKDTYKDKDNQKSYDKEKYPKRDTGSKREPRAVIERGEMLTPIAKADKPISDKVETLVITPVKEPKSDKAENFDAVKGDGKANKVADKSADPKTLDNKVLEKTLENKPSDVKADTAHAKKSDKKEQKRPAKDTDINVRIERLDVKESSDAVVHLSLDGSKPLPKAKTAKTKGDDKAVSVTDEVLQELISVQSELLALLDKPSQKPNDKSKANEPNEQNKPSHQDLDENSSADLTDGTLANDGLDNDGLENSNLDNAKVSDDTLDNANLENAKTDDTLSNDTLDTGNQASQATSGNLAPTPALVRVYHKTTTGTLPSPKSPTPSQHALSTLAKETGRATNDPRVVAKACTTPLTGTAGALIHARLANAQERLAQDGFVACFLEAVNQSGGFDFANYGYAPLQAGYLDKFIAQTSAKGNFATLQGKTDAPPQVIGERAINDPRGAYVEPEPVIEPVAEPATTDDAPHAPTSDAPQDNVLDVGVQETMLVDTSVNDSPANDKADEPVDESKDQPQDSPAQQSVAQGDTAKDSDKAQKDEPKSDGDIRTTPESYKHMIENIAEQLLPPTGILKLANPKKTAKKPATKNPTKVAIKIPKVDTKPKAEIRKRKPKTDDTENQSPSDAE